MIQRKGELVVQLPIDRIRVVNPRARGKVRFKQIVTNISKIGLKKPITVVERSGPDGNPIYDLVCGQGRLEALRSLGETTVPALVIEARQQDLLLMSLAENLARRHPTSVEMLKEIATLRERGYRFSEIAEKTALSVEYVRGIFKLLKAGENSLIKAVERGQIPLHVAVTIATADDEALQRALTEAYEKNDLRGKQLLRARQLIEKRRGKTTRDKAGAQNLTREKLMEEFRRESGKQRALVQKAKLCETRLLFVVSAFKQMIRDAGFGAVLRSGGMSKLPQYLADQIGTSEA